MPNKPFYTISRDKRFKLIKPALKEFLSKPYDSITVSCLTDSMKILRTDFYYYFKDKDDLYNAIIDNIVYFSKVKNDTFTHDLISIIFNKVIKMSGPRNEKYIIECVTGYHPDFIDQFFDSVNKTLNRKTTVEEYLNDKMEFYKLLSVIKLYTTKKIDLAQAKELLK